MIYVFLGPPASGKSTQAKLLGSHFDIPFYSVGGMLRRKAQHDQEIAKKVNSGIMLPAKEVADMITELTQEHPDGIVLDGAFGVADQVDQLARAWNIDRVRVIHVEVPPAVIRERAAHRAHGHVKRKDDSPEVVEKRIDRYFQRLPNIHGRLVSYAFPIITVDGTKTIEAIHETILKELHDYDHPTKKQHRTRKHAPVRTHS